MDLIIELESPVDQSSDTMLITKEQISHHLHGYQADPILQETTTKQDEKKIEKRRLRITLNEIEYEELDNNIMDNSIFTNVKDCFTLTSQLSLF